jgi:hypothetical protein
MPPSGWVQSGYETSLLSFFAVNRLQRSKGYVLLLAAIVLMPEGDIPFVHSADAMIDEGDLLVGEGGEQGSERRAMAAGFLEEPLLTDFLVVVICC